MLMDLTPPSEEPIWQTGFKRKIQQFVVYRRPISFTETSTVYCERLGRRFTKPMPPKTRRSSNA
jgi:hypothetical protein